jgi:hypothetical protein
MKIKARLFTLLFAMICATASWAQTTVSTDQELRDAIADKAIIKLTSGIELSNKTLSIPEGTTVTIDLGGFSLDRKLTKRGENGGQVITVRSGATLNLTGGTLKGGWGGAGGALVNEGGTVTLANVNIINNVADDRGGGICNREGGTLVMTGGVITGNGSNDHSGAKGGGGLFNEEGATATLTGVTITGNTAKLTGGGGICNFGTLTVDGCTIQDNTAGTQGGAIWQEGTLNLQGANVISGNTASSISNNVYIYSGKVITVTGSLAGSSIGVTMQTPGTFTSGFATYHSGTDPATIFTSDCEAFRIVSQNGEGHFVVDYIVCSWDGKNRQVVNTTKTLTRLIGYGDVPTEGDYKLVTNSNNDVDWFQLGGYNGDNDEYYVVSGNVSNNTLNVLGKKVHLILLDGAKLTLSGGILLYGDNHKLSIHCQSYESKMGELIITSGYIDEAAGIGSDWDGDETNGQRKAGDLTIHGGKLSVTGGKISAGIGGGYKQQAGKTTIYGGDIKAYGGSGVVHYGGAGIGGSEHGCGHLVIYGGKVYAEGRDNSPGIGSGVKVYSDPTVTNYLIDGGYPPYNDSKGTYAISVVDIYGGEVEARGANNGAGIGGGNQSNGVILNVYGGDVKAYGGNDGAGIGGGWDGLGGYTVVKGGTVYAKGGGNAAGIGSGSQNNDITHGGILEVKGGHVEAYGGVDAAGIGGGEDADGGVIIISGGYVYAEGNDYGPGIGGGQGGDGADVTITGGTVIAKKGANASGAIDADGGDAQLTLGDDRCVYITNNLWRCQKANRVSDCLGAAYLQISKCLHGGATATIVDGDKHDISSCKWCYVTGEEAHTFRDYGECDACHLISLADDADNSETLSHWAEENGIHAVVLSGRTLNKDGHWNTLCLPFSLTVLEGSPIKDATVKTLKTTAFDNGTLTLNFTDATSIQAGKPYIVKWTPGDPLENPVFTNVTIGNTTNNVETDYVDFCGTYVPVGFQADDQTMLYMGTDNKLHYPDDAVTINAFHSYFLLKGLDKSTLPADNIVMTFSMNHEPTGIEMMSDGRGKMSDAWYDLQGRKLNFKPTQKGVYINNGKIRVIK